MIVVDTHCHAGRNWFEPVELLLYQMSLNNVDKAALIGHGGSFDNTYLLECMQRFPGRFAVVVVIDTDAPDAPATLEQWAAAGAGGVRLGPAVRSPGADPLAIWRKAAELGLVVSSLGQPAGFASREFAQAVAEFPQLPIIVEHLAGVGIGAAPPYAAYKAALAVARYPNTYIKVGGLGEISARPPVLRPKFAIRPRPAAARAGLRRLWAAAHDVGERLSARQRAGRLSERSARRHGPPGAARSSRPRVDNGEDGTQCLPLHLARRPTPPLYLVERGPGGEVPEQ